MHKTQNYIIILIWNNIFLFLIILHIIQSLDTILKGTKFRDDSINFYIDNDFTHILLMNK